MPGIPRPLVHLALWLCATILIAGCTEPVSMDKYARIDTGMSEARVYDIMGEPDSAESIELGGYSGTLATWKGKNGVITVQIFNGEVFGKQYSSAQSTQGKD